MKEIVDGVSTPTFCQHTDGWILLEISGVSTKFKEYHEFDILTGKQFEELWVNRNTNEQEIVLRRYYNGY